MSAHHPQAWEALANAKHRAEGCCFGRMPAHDHERYTWAPKVLDELERMGYAIVRTPTIPTEADFMQWVEERGLNPHIDARLKKFGEEVGEVFGAAVAMDEDLTTKYKLGQEMAQVFLCLRGIAGAAGIDLDAEIEAEWERIQTRRWPHLEERQ